MEERMDWTLRKLAAEAAACREQLKAEEPYPLESCECIAHTLTSIARAEKAINTLLQLYY